jgi:hypothetical protein
MGLTHPHSNTSRAANPISTRASKARQKDDPLVSEARRIRRQSARRQSRGLLRDLLDRQNDRQLQPLADESPTPQAGAKHTAGAKRTTLSDFNNSLLNTDSCDEQC